MKIEKYRYVILTQLFLSVFCTGVTYAWSIFARGLQEFHGWNISDVTLGYSLLAIMLAIFGIFSGQILDKFGSRWLLLFAGVLFGGGWWIMSFSTSIVFFWFASIVIGIGDGLLYNTALTTAIRCFPEKSGFISGMMVGAAGLAPLIISPLANYFVDTYTVNGAFRIFGTIFIIVVGSGFFLTKDPKPGWTPEGYDAQREQTAARSVMDVGPKGMMRDIKFYLLWFAFFCGCNSGLLLISNGSQIGTDLAGLTPALAAAFVGILAVFNFIGRMLIGYLGDKVGRIKSLYGIYTVMVLIMLFFGQADTSVKYLLANGFIGVAFGGLMANFPVITGEIFGTRRQGSNYGIMFTAYGIAAFTGPMVGAKFRERTGSWTGAFIFAAILAAVSLVLIYLTHRNLAKQKS